MAAYARADEETAAQARFAELLNRLDVALAGARDRDDVGFRTELLALLPALRCFALSLVHAPDQADDLVQDALVRAWRSRAGFTPGTTLPAMYSADVAGGPAVGLVPVRPLPASYGVWGQAFGAFGDAGDRNAARLTRQVGGFVLGAETGAGVLGSALGAGLDDWRAGVAAGYSFTAFDVTARQSTGQVESGFGAVYARGPLGPLQVRLGAAYAGNALDTRRAVLFPGFSQSVSGRAGGDTAQGFGEVGYRIGLVAGYVEPFVGGAAIHIRRDGFSEVGGASALTVYGRSYDVQTASAGVQGQAVVAELFGGAGPLVARGLVGYRRAFGDVVPQALLAFGAGARRS